MFDFLFGSGNEEAKNAYWDALAQKAQANANKKIFSDLYNASDDETKNYLNNLGITPGTLDESARLADEALKQADSNLNQGQLRFDGGSVDLMGGLLGAIFNPAVRLAGDIGAGVTGNLDKYQKLNERDALSSIGDIISLAGNFAVPTTALSGASLGAKALAGAGIAGAANAGDYLGSTSTANRNAGDLANSIGMGAAFGAAIPALGAGAKKLGSSVANTGRNAIANQAMQQGYGQAMANQIAQNTGRGTQIAAGLGKTIKSKPFKIGAGAVAGGTLLSNLLGNRNANQTGYNDDATYGSDLYGTTQGYNYGTYGY